MPTFIMKPQTTITSNEFGASEVMVNFPALKSFAGSLQDLLVHLHQFLRQLPDFSIDDHIGFTIDGVEVTQLLTNHDELFTDVAAMIKLLPIAIHRTVTIDGGMVFPVASHAQRQEMYKLEQDLTHARKHVTYSLGWGSIHDEDVEQLRDVLKACRKHDIVKIAMNEGWVDDPIFPGDDCEFMYLGSDYGNWQGGVPTEVKAKEFVVDLTSMALSKDQIGELVATGNTEGVAVQPHEKGVLIYYFPELTRSQVFQHLLPRTSAG